jgi:hypothetical protein
MEEFTASGGQEIGNGRFGKVLAHPKWNYVLKMFNDEYYLRFVRYAVRHPHPAFPRFQGTAQKVIPFYRRFKSEATTYIIRIEKLKPVTDKKMLSELVEKYQSAIMYMHAVGRGEGNKEYEKVIYPSLKDRQQGIGERTVKIRAFGDIIDFLEKYPQAKNLYEAIFLVSKNISKGALDIHSGNIMERDNGDLVLIDPLWEGDNPFGVASYGNQEYNFDSTEDLIGGELPKRKRK